MKARCDVCLQQLLPLLETQAQREIFACVEQGVTDLVAMSEQTVNHMQQLVHSLT